MAYYKAFKKGMICKGKQYAENTDFEEKGANECCVAGVMHFCKEPMDVLNYYPLVDENGDFSEFSTVEPLEKVIEKVDKCASKKIHIGAKLSFKGFIEAAVNVLIEKTKGKNESGDGAKIGSSGNYAKIGSSGDDAQIGSSGNYAKIGSSGNYAQIGSSGNYAQIGSSGNGAQIGSSGDYAKIGSSGDGAKIGSSGNYAQIGSSGNYAQIGSSGNGAQIGSSGDYAKIGSSGDGARIKMDGTRSVASCVGNGGAIKGKKGCWIVLAEWKIINDEYTPVCVKAAQIDGETLKEDTFYRLENGEFVEVEE